MREPETPPPKKSADRLTWLLGHLEEGEFVLSGMKGGRKGWVILRIAPDDMEKVRSFWNQAKKSGDPIRTQGSVAYNTTFFHDSALASPELVGPLMCVACASGVSFESSWFGPGKTRTFMMQPKKIAALSI